MLLTAKGNTQKHTAYRNACWRRLQPPLNPRMLSCTQHAESMASSLHCVPHIFWLSLPRIAVCQEIFPAKSQEKDVHGDARKSFQPNIQKKISTETLWKEMCPTFVCELPASSEMLAMKQVSCCISFSGHHYAKCPEWVPYCPDVNGSVAAACQETEGEYHQLSGSALGHGWLHVRVCKDTAPKGADAALQNGSTTCKVPSRIRQVSYGPQASGELQLAYRACASFANKLMPMTSSLVYNALVLRQSFL